MVNCCAIAPMPTPLNQLSQLSHGSINHRDMNHTINHSTDMTQTFAAEKSVAKFLVMFTPEGQREVSPWLSQES